MVTPAQIKMGTSDESFHFTAPTKQNPQSNSRSLWGLGKDFALGFTGVPGSADWQAFREEEGALAK